ncbi:MAG: ABC transporter permease subunit [Alphaproteobacteria bacterium]|nr:ABC transporter permease subunit [Alphaproteobacteria bacterium]
MVAVGLLAVHHIYIADRTQEISMWAPRLILLLIAVLFWNGALKLTPTAANTPWFWAATIGLWLVAWWLVAQLAEAKRAPGILGRLQPLLAPLLFGATLLWLWEVIVRALEVPRVILPAPSGIWTRILASLDTLWIDFLQTFVKGALSGYAIGVGAAFLFALAVDRSDFLRRGLLPVGNFLAALPIIGTAPIMVMWFGFDWPSKAAVVVAMVFFPMLVNTVQGLTAADRMQRDLMHTYSANWVQSLLKLRLPAAMPFIFNGLKVASTLALIGAIVAEFFGSPTRGMGFRISTEVGRLQLDMVWAEIAVAALAGSLFYGLIALVERGVTFWHPSQRGR